MEKKMQKKEKEEKKEKEKEIEKEEKKEKEEEMEKEKKEMEKQKLLHGNNQLWLFLLYSFSDPRKSEFLGEFPAFPAP